MTGTPIALTIAGSDSSGGAGIQADLKTFSAFGVYGASVITALTAQNTLGVTAVEPVAASFVAAQMEAVLCDLAVGAIKTGMLANAGIIEAVARRLRDGPRRLLVVDPVMVATSGDVLLEVDAVDALKRELFPQALLITPNLPEAARLLDGRVATSEAEVAAQAQALLALGCQAVLLKGGHGSGEKRSTSCATPPASSASCARRSRHTHGTGCTLSALSALLAGRGAAGGRRPRQSLRLASLAGGRALGTGRQRPGRPPVRHPPPLRRLDAAASLGSVGVRSSPPVVSLSNHEEA
jgi:hydroxymethylpyrimidine/phosphomethylpyrimidine kinase